MTEKLPTGCTGLDQVLFGGIPKNTLSVIMGAPGTGKTILAESIAFHNASPDSPALYLTTFSEPLEKFILHGQTYSFFDSDKVGSAVIYQDLGDRLLEEGGVEKLPEIVADLFIKYKPKLLFIDSFKALNELMPVGSDRQLVIFQLAKALSVYCCTSFLIGEYSPEMTTNLPEFAVADVVLHLMKYSSNVREQRFLRVEKLRGSDSIQGLHAFSISATGIEMYPRILTPKVLPNYEPKVERVNTGIAGLDEMIETGFWRGSTTIVAGPSGSGKTVLSMHFIREGARLKEPGVYLGFQENPTQLARVMLNLGWGPADLLGSGLFEFMYRSPVEMQLDCVAAELFARIRQGKVRRVVIDALGDLERCSTDTQRFADFIYALMQWFAVENVTCMMTYEIPELFEVHQISNQQLSNMTDNLVLLGLSDDAEMQRTVRIIKTRGSAHDNRRYPLEIGNQGAKVKKK